MSETAESFQGVLGDQSIKLDRASSLPDGCMVNVTVRKARLPELEREAKLKSLFGGCSDDADARYDSSALRLVRRTFG